MNDKTTLGTFLRAAREKHSLSLRAVEKKVGISNAYLSQIESGKINQPSPNILFKLATFFELSYNDLLQLADYPTKDDIEEEVGTSFVARLGPVTENEQDALLEYLEFLRSRRSRKE
jgi:transcriptional regulator with XRE-family HTH domain